MIYTDGIHVVGTTLQELHEFAMLIGLSRKPALVKVRLQYVGETIGAFRKGMKRTFGIPEDGLVFPCRMCMKLKGKEWQDIEYWNEELWELHWKIVADSYICRH